MQLNQEIIDFQNQIKTGIPEILPPPASLNPQLNHAPSRVQVLSEPEKIQSLTNALRYFPQSWHKELAPEFAKELSLWGRIYMMRFKPSYSIHARPIEHYGAKSVKSAAIMLMIQNNLDPAIAQHPEELITYGGNGAVFQNWAQYLITMKYLSEMEDDQTLVLYSGHPLGLFPSSVETPNLVVTNGMVIPNYSSREHYEKFASMGVTSYGQMTAGSFMYIGPQGIVHGTTITLLNAGRLWLGTTENLKGKVFVTSGLGGMSGAQGKAAVISGAASIIAEINPQAAEKRHSQGWVDVITYDVDEALQRCDEARKQQKPVSIAYVGNIVTLWERILETGFKVDLGSDQTSLHLPFSGGYYPDSLSFEESNSLMSRNPERFKLEVQASLRKHVRLINALCERGMKFWDYGNAFLLESSKAEADITNPDGSFYYPSYVEDIMGPMCFDYGFGPFRWVCTSGNQKDLQKTDEIAAGVLENHLELATEDIKLQVSDNLHWIKNAMDNNLVVGSKARILYADSKGRIEIARAFNNAIRDGVISAPVVLGRDHHDVSGTDSPWRETANIKDGSRFTADMAIQNVIGDAMRGASWVSIHNGGGVGWGEVINGGFGMVLDGTELSEKNLESMLFFDVNNGLARRAWARNKGAVDTVRRTQEIDPRLKITLPHELPDSELLINSIDRAYLKND
ncbi:MAG: urocanate hydratase [Deltaproteobacteria bacterium]|nr:urocanate hydratase [Deltaproteobacteria bacterium]